MTTTVTDPSAPQAPAPLFMADPKVLTIALGMYVDWTPAVSGGSGSRTFALSGSLPAGLAFNTSTGQISGTPTAIGTSKVTVTVTDSTGSYPRAFPIGPVAVNTTQAFPGEFIRRIVVPSGYGGAPVPLRSASGGGIITPR